MIRAALVSFVMVLSLQAVNAQTDAVRVDLSGVVEGNNRFALDLYRQLRSEDGNLFYSPSSIAIAFSMTYAGAADETAAQIHILKSTTCQLSIIRITAHRSFPDFPK